MTSQMYLCLGIFLFMILGFVFADKLRTTLGSIALAAIMLVSFSGLVEAKTVLANFANKNVLLITGMFIVSAGFNRTQAVNKVSALVYRVSSGKFTVMLGGYLAIAFVLTQLIPSPMVVFGIVSPLLAASCDSFNISPSKVMFSLGLVCVSCCMCTPVGSGATTFAQQNAFMESYGYTDYPMQLLDPFKGRILVSAVMFAYALFIAPKTCPDTPSNAITMQAAKKGANAPAPLSPVREFLGYGIFICTTLGLIFQSKLGVENWQIAMTGAAIVLLSGVLNAKEATAAIPVRIILLLVSALCVGGAMVSCGLGDLIGEAIANLMRSLSNGYLIGFIFFVIPFLLTQVMQNQSVMNIFTPIVILTCKSLGANPVGPILLLNTACLTAFLTPMATGTIPPMMDAGGYNQRDLLKIGWIPSVVVCVVATLVIMTVFPL